jgi:site-specific DNA-methyltransferase (adenine-specific)
MSNINLICGDSVEKLKELDDNSIDLTVTSPPYDALRSYNGNNDIWGEHVWKDVIQDLYRVTKDGGVVVWVVGDATIKGSETGTSFKQALWAKDCGFNLHDTMFWLKDQLAFPDSNRYYNAVEYMFVLSKGKPKTFTPICDKKNKAFGRFVDNSGGRIKTGGIRKQRSCAGNPIKKFGVRWNYWLIYNLSRVFTVFPP